METCAAGKSVGVERPENNSLTACTLSQLMDQYCTVLQQEKPADEATQRRYREYLDTMLQLMDDRDIGSYRHHHLLTLKSQLLRWPVNAGKALEFRGKTAAEILRMKVAKPLDKKVVDSKYMAKITAVFQYAFRIGLTSGDITQSLTPSLTVAQQRVAKRKMYNADELSRIFAALPVHRDRPHLAWLPLLAAYSGALPGELCRLRVADINVSHRIPHLVITSEDGRGTVIRNLRDEVSIRLVPIHPVVVAMGFLRFVARRKNEGHQFLFEKRRRTGDGHEPLTGAYYAESFELFNRKLISNDLRKGFDSFRRNVQHELQLRNVAPQLCHAITGQVPQYDDPAAPGTLLAEKYAALVQLHYPQIDVQALKEKFQVFDVCATSSRSE